MCECGIMAPDLLRMLLANATGMAIGFGLGCQPHGYYAFCSLCYWEGFGWEHLSGKLCSLGEN